IRFQPERGWDWDLDAIDVAQVPDDIGQIITGRIARIASGPRELLQLASCVGDRCNLETLAGISETPREQLESQLAELVQEGLLVASRGGLQFAHDRVREAAQSLWSAEERARVHRRVGRRLLEHTPREALPERAVEIAEHLNRALALGVTSEEER